MRIADPLLITGPDELVALSCRRSRIRKLSFFGSVLTPRFGPKSDVDMLVEFEAEARPSRLTMAHLERELPELLGRGAY